MKMSKKLKRDTDSVLYACAGVFYYNNSLCHRRSN